MKPKLIHQAKLDSSNQSGEAPGEKAEKIKTKLNFKRKCRSID
jgi:hypothetical protein